MTRSTKIKSLILAVTLVSLTGCATVVRPDGGRPHDNKYFCAHQPCPMSQHEGHNGRSHGGHHNGSDHNKK